MSLIADWELGKKELLTSKTKKQKFSSLRREKNIVKNSE